MRSYVFVSGQKHVTHVTDARELWSHCLYPLNCSAVAILPKSERHLTRRGAWRGNGSSPEARDDALVGDHADCVLRPIGIAPVDLLLQAVLPLPQLLQVPGHGRIELLGDHLQWSMTQCDSFVVTMVSPP